MHNNIDISFVRVDAFRNMAQVCDRVIDIFFIQKQANEINMSASERAAVNDVIRARALELTI